MQEQHSKWFEPPLDAAKKSAIEKLGIGIVDKFFLTFDDILDSTPEGQKQYQLLWRQNASSLMPGGSTSTRDACTLPQKKALVLPM